MINANYAKKFCRDDIIKIENYEKAMADRRHVWHCHHRLELTLDREFAHSREDLKRLGMYYHRPYFELIFLTKAEHVRLHGKARSPETLAKMSAALKGEKNPLYGKHRDDEAKQKISEAKKGKKLGPFTEEHRAKIAEARRKYWRNKRAATDKE